MDRYVRRLGLAILTITFLAACSVAAPSVPPGATATPGVPTVDSRTYLSTGVSGATLVPGTRVRLSFKDGHLNASGGCNAMGGAYTIAGGRLTTPEMMTTEMGCDQPRMDQDSWLAGLLGGSTIVLAGDTLTLANGTIRLTLRDREVADPDRSIEGTRWVLDGIISGDTASSVPAGVTASIRIADGQVAVDAGCNGGSGPVAVGPDTLTFGPLRLSKKACQAGPAAVEAAVTQVLAGTVSYRVEADALTLDAGSSGLMFRAAS